MERQPEPNLLQVISRREHLALASSAAANGHGKHGDGKECNVGSIDIHDCCHDRSLTGTDSGLPMYAAGKQIHGEEI
jgi:hypothetical protein